MRGYVAAVALAASLAVPGPARAAPVGAGGVAFSGCFTVDSTASGPRLGANVACPGALGLVPKQCHLVTEVDGPANTHAETCSVAANVSLSGLLLCGTGQLGNQFFVRGADARFVAEIDFSATLAAGQGQLTALVKWEGRSGAHYFGTAYGPLSIAGQTPDPCDAETQVRVSFTVPFQSAG